MFIAAAALRAASVMPFRFCRRQFLAAAYAFAIAATITPHYRRRRRRCHYFRRQMPLIFSVATPTDDEMPL
jgi:hypothetical protein